MPWKYFADIWKVEATEFPERLEKLRNAAQDVLRRDAGDTCTSRGLNLLDLSQEHKREGEMDLQVVVAFACRLCGKSRHELIQGDRVETAEARTRL